MAMIDSKEAAAALDDIETMAQRVRQSLVYRLASLMAMLWGVLVAVGYLASFLAPGYAGLSWISVYIVGFAASVAIGVTEKARTGIHAFDWRIAATVLIFIAFGFGFLFLLGGAHLTARQISAFWPVYYMMAYTLAGLWFGTAFVVMGLSITALTLIGYFLVGPWFDLWMAVVNGGGLLLAGFWMRRK